MPTFRYSILTVRKEIEVLMSMISIVWNFSRGDHNPHKCTSGYRHEVIHLAHDVKSANHQVAVKPISMSRLKGDAKKYHKGQISASSEYKIAE